jgi:hypothetical protein
VAAGQWQQGRPCKSRAHGLRVWGAAQRCGGAKIQGQAHRHSEGCPCEQRILDRLCKSVRRLGRLFASAAGALLCDTSMQLLLFQGWRDFKMIGESLTDAVLTLMLRRSLAGVTRRFHCTA